MSKRPTKTIVYQMTPELARALKWLRASNWKSTREVYENAVLVACALDAQVVTTPAKRRAKK